MPIEIEGKLVQVVERRVLRSVNLDDWLTALSARQPSATPLLPPGCRYYQRKAERELYVIEQPPTRRVVTWQSVKPWGDETKEDARWRLAFPYVVFVVQPNPIVVRIYYRTAPLAQLTDPLMCANLGNVYLGHNVCLANTRDIAAMTDPVEKVNALVTSFWSSEFNSDLLDLFLKMARKQPAQLGTLAKWEEASAANPLFVLEVPWEPAGTLKDVLAAAGGEV